MHVPSRIDYRVDKVSSRHLDLSDAMRRQVQKEIDAGRMKTGYQIFSVVLPNRQTVGVKLMCDCDLVKKWVSDILAGKRADAPGKTERGRKWDRQMKKRYPGAPYAFSAGRTDHLATGIPVIETPWGGTAAGLTHSMQVASEDSVGTMATGDALKICVADGVGGQPDGDLAAEIITRHALLHDANTGKGMRKAQDALCYKANIKAAACTFIGTLKKDAGAETFTLGFEYAGDVQGMVIAPNGTVRATEEHTLAKEKLTAGAISVDEYYAGELDRRTVTNYVQVLKRYEPTRQEFTGIEKGSRIVVGTDGFFDQFTPDETALLLQFLEQGGRKSPQEICRAFTEFAFQRMRSERVALPFTPRLTTPKPDDLGMVVVEV